MKNLASTWILFSSVFALAMSVVVFAQAAESLPSSTTPSTPEGGSRPALRGDRALGPFMLFDTNHDGTLSADEIANSAAALRKLDKNSDGKLTADELRPKGPPPPPREGGPDSGERRGDRQRPPEGEL